MDDAFRAGVLAKFAAAKPLTEDEAEKAFLYGAGGVGGSFLANTALASTLRPSNTKWSQAQAEQMMRQMKIHRVRINPPSGISMGDVGMGWHKNAPFVQVPGGRGAEFLAHELGHVPRRHGGQASEIMKAKVSRSWVPLAGTGIGTLMAVKGQRGSLATRAAPFVSLAGSAPMLYDEARASVRGYKALKALKQLSPAELGTARRKLLHAFGTYGAMAAMMTAPAAALAAIKWNKNKNKEKKR